MATNDLPFMGQGGGMLNAGAALPELDEKWSRNLNEIMQACLSKDTWDRPTAEDLEEYTHDILKGKDISWSKWKSGEKEGSDDIKTQSSKKWILWAALCFITIITCLFIFSGKGNDNHEQIAIEQRYMSLKSMCENNINVGSAQNYMSLLSASVLMDSLKWYQDNYSYISDKPDNSLKGLESSLSMKLSEAQAAWIRSADGQLNIAEDVSTAIIYYHIASLLKNSSTINNAISNIARDYGCNGAYMVITKTKVEVDKLIIDYNGLNSSTINGVTIKYELENLRGQATISIMPGNNKSVTISLNGTPSSQNLVRLSNNGVVFYDSSLME